jgi:hypothetical protein
MSFQFPLATEDFAADVGLWWDRLAPRKRLLLLSALGLIDYRYNCLYQWSRVSSYVQEIITLRIAMISVAFESKPPPEPAALSQYFREFPLHPEQKH